MEEKQIRPRGLEDARCKDLTGKRFGFFTVIGIDTKRIDNRVTWICKCKCGTVKSIPSNFLVQGRTKSCGCQHHRRGRGNPNWKGYEEIGWTKWGHLLHNAKDRKIPCLISIKYAWKVFLNQNRKCALSGLPLTFSSRSNGKDGNASIDRIDSTKGYIKGNIQWIDKRFNWMKNNYSQLEFLSLCKLVTDYNTNGKTL